MDVLRQDVEAMEKEMEELRAYLAKTDENREDEEHTLKDDDINYQEAGKNTIRPSACSWSLGSFSNYDSDGYKTSPKK